MSAPADQTSLKMEPVEFWFVWTKKGRVPRNAHNNAESAEKEATRLAGLNPGKKFIVLRAYAKFSCAPAVEAEPVAEAA